MNRLRVATLADQKELETLYNGFVHAMMQYDDDDADTIEVIQQWICDALTNANGKLWVIETEYEIAGFARLSKKTRRDEKGMMIPYVKLQDIYVKPSVRRRGIASQLIDASIQWAKLQGCKEMILNVYTHNTAARKLYSVLSFCEAEQLSNQRIRMKYILYP